MSEKQLFWIALFSSIIGMIGLTFICYFYEYNLTAIGDIDEKYIGETVLIEGEITGLRDTKGVYMFEIKDETGIIKGVIFSDEADVFNDKRYKVLGEVTEYNNELEINVERLESL